MDKTAVAEWFRGLQEEICRIIENLDGTAGFHEDLWERPGGGGGRSRIIEGDVIEKGGVNFSAVHGEAPERMLKALELENTPEDVTFYATGVSSIMHPINPWVPIIHMNVRYFELSNGIYWFGGGIDLTPHYVNKAEAAYFHREIKKTCDLHHPAYYDAFKAWADDYFYIKHRQETRGIGGIFFDKLSTTEDIDFEQRYHFVQDIGKLYAPLYAHLASQKKQKPFNEAQKTWQLLRRSRYAEFNLVLDRGTRFGLDSEGRTESILMSLPPYAQWKYNYIPEAGSPEEMTLSLLKKDIDWAHMKQ